jgi:hypothetical protein
MDRVFIRLLQNGPGSGNLVAQESNMTDRIAAEYMVDAQGTPPVFIAEPTPAFTNVVA